jgi:hypothetical protein
LGPVKGSAQISNDKPLNDIYFDEIFPATSGNSKSCFAKFFLYYFQGSSAMSPDKIIISKCRFNPTFNTRPSNTSLTSLQTRLLTDHREVARK